MSNAARAIRPLRGRSRATRRCRARRPPAAKAATRAEPTLRERYDRWSGRRADRELAIKLARQIQGRWSEDTIIGGKPHQVVSKGGCPSRPSLRWRISSSARSCATSTSAS